MRYATKDDLVDLFGEAKSKYGTLDPNGGLKRTGNALGVDFTEVASVDALEGATALSPTGGIVSTQDGLAISPAQQTTGAIDGALLELTAKSKQATQETTTGKNLCDDLTMITGKWINDEGVINSAGGNMYSDKIPVDVGATYSFGVSVVGDSYKRVVAYDSNDTFVSLLCKLVQTFGTRQSATFEIPANTAYVRVSVNTTDTNIQLELGSTATPYEPYTGGAPSPSPDYPQEIQVTRGRNLLKLTGRVAMPTTSSTPTDAKTMDGTGYWVGIAFNGYVRRSNITGEAQIQDENVQLTTIQKGYGVGFEIKLKTGGTYCINYKVATSDDTICIGFFNDEGKNIRYDNYLASGSSFTVPSNCGCCLVVLTPGTLNQVVTYSEIQLTLGSTPMPYVPYGHVGMEARDPDTDELISCTALPLPSRGWVAGLPDGTADTLTLDGAGGVQWEKQTEEVVLDGSSDESWALMSNGKCCQLFNVSTKPASSSNIAAAFMADSLAVDSWNTMTEAAGRIAISTNATMGANVTNESTTLADFRTWLATHPVTVLYPLATPVTEDCGYIEGWTNDFSEGCVLSIPELDDLGIEYHIDGAVSTLVHQWYERARYEYEDRIDALESAVAELVAGE